MGKSASAKSAFYREIKTWDPPVEKKTVEKAYLVDMEELFEFEHSFLEALCAHIYSFITL